MKTKLTHSLSIHTHTHSQAAAAAASSRLFGIHTRITSTQLDSCARTHSHAPNVHERQLFGQWYAVICANYIQNHDNRM